jgi:phage tail-like protein
MADQFHSLLLNARLGWHGAQHDPGPEVGLAEGAVLHLLALPNGPLSFQQPDNSLGGITLPQRMAIDVAGRLHLLSSNAPWLLRFDPDSRTFVPLPSLGSEGSDARQFSNPRAIATFGWLLYVADTGNHRIQVFDTRTLALEHVWTFATGRPVDLASGASGMYVLESEHGRVYHHIRGSNDLRLVIDLPQITLGQYTKIAVDRSGHIYVFDYSANQVWEYDTDGQLLNADAIRDASQIRDRFDPPAIRMQFDDRHPDTAYFFWPVAPADMTVTAALEEPLGPYLRAIANPPVQPNRLELGNLCDPQMLLQTLRRRRDPLAQYLYEWLSTQTRGLLEERKIWDGIPKALLEQAVQELDAVLLDPKLYHANRFTEIPLTADLQNQVRQRERLATDELRRMNYALIAQAYPDEVGQPEGPPTLFDQHGQRRQLDLAEVLFPVLYEQHGVWVSDPLDSSTPRCAWDTIELEVDALPVGTQITVSTTTSDELDNAISPDLWTRSFTSTGQRNQAISIEDHAGKRRLFEPANPHTGLVQSQPGRYLRLKIEFKGDGFASPKISAMRLHFQRDSYLKYLPAVYQHNEDARNFMERFLAVFQSEWQTLEHRLESMDGLFDPNTAPEGFLDPLAHWLGLPLEATWNAEQKRNLMRAARAALQQHGTASGLKRFLQAYLQNMSGLSPESQGGYPVLLEGFRERLRFTARGSGSSLPVPLWSAARVGRLQTDSQARLGEVRLVSTGDPDREVFEVFAHRFKVFVPAHWVRNDDQEALLRRALEHEKPAETQYELVLVEPRFRVGVQSMLGVDTILGDYPITRLGCDEKDTSSTTRAPHGRLGYDTILSSTGDATATLSSKNRLGYQIPIH